MSPTWKTFHQTEFGQSYFQDLKSFLTQEIKDLQTIYPHPREFFAAFDLCPFEEVKVVILGQDPYHGPNQAHGLSFSVNPGQKIPPSLQNIDKELEQDLKIPRPQHGDLRAWTREGVLLLNSTLSVRAGSPASHSQKGWETFTDRMIQAVSEQKDAVVFCLWGQFARSKKPLIDQQKHLVLEAPHPSPFSAHSGFFGCRHFSQANRFLAKRDKITINWSR